AAAEHAERAQGKDADPERRGGARMLAHRAHAQALRSPGQPGVEEQGNHERGVSQRRMSEAVAGKSGRRRADAARPEHRLEQVGDEPERDEVQSDAAHHLIRAELEREDRVHGRRGGAGQRAATQADPRRPGEDRPGSGGERAEAHHPFQPDVDHAGSLAENAAEGGEHQGRGEIKDQVHGWTVGIGGALDGGRARPRRRRSTGWKRRGAATSRTANPWVSYANEGWMSTSCRRVAPARSAPKTSAASALPQTVPPPTRATAIPSKPYPVRKTP